MSGTMALHEFEIFVHFEVNLCIFFLLELNAFLTNLAVASIYRQKSGKILK